MTKKTRKAIVAMGHTVYGVNTVSDYIKKADGTIINVKKITSGIFFVWGAFNNMKPEPMVDYEILALC